MADYMLTAWSKAAGWRDIAVRNAGDMHEAIAAAERVTGCRVSHGRGGIGSAFHPGTTIDLESGEVTVHHTREAKPEVVMGPPAVLAAIRAALTPHPKAAPRRKTGKPVPADED